MSRDPLFAQSWAGRPFRNFPLAASDFGVTDADNRHALTRHIVGLRPQGVIKDTDRHRLVVVGSPPLSYLCMVEKPDDTLVFLVRCHATYVDFLNETVAEVAVWRDNRSAAVQDTTERAFEYLLAEFPVLLSDGELTESGANFWVRRMAMATHRGHRVGLADVQAETVVWCEADFRHWTGAHRRAWSHGTPDNIRFVISRG